MFPMKIGCFVSPTSALPFIFFVPNFEANIKFRKSFNSIYKLTTSNPRMLPCKFPYLKSLIPPALVETLPPI